MSDLVGFLRDRIAEDEAAAQAAAPGPWEIDEDGCCVATDELGIIAETHAGMPLLPQTATVTHIARWDPARVLAEVAAKRTVLDDYQIILANNAVERATKPDDVRDAVQGLMVKTLRMVLLRWAQVHASHPDFDPAWKVE